MTDPFAASPPTSTPISQEERTWALAAHLSALAGYVIPFGNVIAPLVIWLIQKDKMPFVDDQGKEAVNFQISVTIYALACLPLIFVLVGIPLLIAIGLAGLILLIVAAIKANDGVYYRYPLTIRFIR
jgi:uncharacterized Tic20 family protein